MNNTTFNATILTNTTQGSRLFGRNYASLAVTSFVLLFGVLGNFLVVASILKQSRLLKKNYYYLILHLAVCDLVFLLTVTLDTIVDWFPKTGSYVFNSTVMCKIWTPLSTLFFTAGANIMILVSVLRYRAVVYPLKAAVSRWKLGVVCGLVYAIAIVCLVPLILVLEFTKSGGCVQNWPNQAQNKAYTLFLSTIQCFIPVTLLSILYIKLCRTLLKQMDSAVSPISNGVASDLSRTQTHSQRLRRRRNVKTFTTCATVVLCFGLTSVPMQLWYIPTVFGSLEYDETIYRWTLVVSLAGTSAVNPLIYGALDKNLDFPILKKLKGVLFRS